MSASSTRSQTGRSLAKGPVAIIGLLGIAFGVAGLIFGGHGFHTASIPHGSITGTLWLGVMANGWTNLLFIAAGLLLLLGSSMHWSAKTTAFVVAGVLGAAAVIALIRGNGVFGIFAANHRTEIIWGGAAILLVLLSLLPRVGGTSRTDQEPVGRRDRVRDEPVATNQRRDRVRDESVAHEQPVTREEPVVRDESVAHDELVAPRSRTVGDETTVPRDERSAGVDRDAGAVRADPVAGDDTAASDRGYAGPRS